MHARRGVLSAVAASAALVCITACGSGNSTVEGSAEAPPPPPAETTTTEGLPDERPVEPTGDIVPPPPPPPPEGEHPPEGEPPPPDEVPPPEPAPEGAAEFDSVMHSMGIHFPEPHVPAVVARDTCVRFDHDEPMADVQGWLGGFTEFDDNTQGRFLGAAVATYCPHNFAKLQ